MDTITVNDVWRLHGVWIIPSSPQDKGNAKAETCGKVPVITNKHMCKKLTFYVWLKLSNIPRKVAEV